MERVVRKKVKELLDSGKVIAVIGLKEELGKTTPFLFTRGDDYSKLKLSPHYPLATVAMKLHKADPEYKFAMLCRGCDERALIEMAKRNQINLDNIKLIGIACDENTAKDCNCKKPYPSCEDTIGDKLVDFVPEDLYEDFKNMSTEEKLEFWKKQFLKCNKCYGCRDICPMCFCKECELENGLWLRKGRLPPDYPVYHLIRAFHLAGKCIGCGECEKACPAGIPLMTLNRLIRDDMKDLFDFVSGMDLEEVNPLYTKEEF